MAGYGYDRIWYGTVRGGAVRYGTVRCGVLRSVVLGLAGKIALGGTFC